MTKLYPIILISLSLSFLAQSPLFYQTGIGTERRYNKAFFVCLVLALVLFAGLRTSYNDTGGYTYSYRHLATGKAAFLNFDWKLGDNPGFNIVNMILRWLHVSDQSFLLFYAAVTVSIYVWFIFRYSVNPAFSIFLLFSMGAYTFTMAAIKQCIAIAFCLLATHFAMEKKWKLFIFWVLIASTFHAYALMFLILPLLDFQPWSGKTWLMLAAFAGAGIMLQSLIGTVISVTSMLGEEYDAATFSGDGVNPFRLAVVSVPILISFVAKSNISAQRNKRQNLILNLSILNAEIMFVALFGTANYFARLANYFLLFQTISIPWLLTFFEKKSRRLITFVAVLCYAAYMYYGHAINETFDLDYSGITLISYLRSGFFSG